MTKENEEKVKLIVLLIFFGFLGVHRFYAGKVITGILFCLSFGGLGVWYVVDLFLIITDKFCENNNRQISDIKSTANAQIRKNVIENEIKYNTNINSKNSNGITEKNIELNDKKSATEIKKSNSLNEEDEKISDKKSATEIKKSNSLNEEDEKISNEDLRTDIMLLAGDKEKLSKMSGIYTELVTGGKMRNIRQLPSESVSDFLKRDNCKELSKRISETDSIKHYMGCYHGLMRRYVILYEYLNPRIDQIDNEIIKDFNELSNPIKKELQLAAPVYEIIKKIRLVSSTQSVSDRDIVEKLFARYQSVLTDSRS